MGATCRGTACPLRHHAELPADATRVGPPFDPCVRSLCHQTRTSPLSQDPALHSRNRQANGCTTQHSWTARKQAPQRRLCCAQAFVATAHAKGGGRVPAILVPCLLLAARG